VQRLLRGIFAAENYSTILLCYKKPSGRMIEIFRKTEGLN
jgi:hypothetical protein